MIRTVQVDVAIVQDQQGRFLVTYNPKWDGYTFPMINVPEGGDSAGSQAIAAVEHDLGCRLPGAQAFELDRLTKFGVSQRTGESTHYTYQLYDIKPGLSLTLASDAEYPPLYLTFDELISRADLTWSTSAIVEDFVLVQDAVLAVVTRAGETETEFLLVYNANYNGYFFPTQRCKNEVLPDAAARITLRDDLGYRGPATVTYVREITDIHLSKRYGRDRLFRFHVCHVEITDVDLHQPKNLLEKALAKRSKKSVWLRASELAQASGPLSPTLTAIESQVVSMIPRRVFAAPLRRSEGGVALISRTVDGKTQWLTQWNDAWNAFFFVGGHREGTETFRACVIREIEEELGLKPAQCPVDAQPFIHHEYKAISRSAGQLTHYIMELYCARPTAIAQEKIASNSMNKWLDEKEISQLAAHDGRAISVTVKMLLELSGLI